MPATDGPDGVELKGSPPAGEGLGEVDGVASDLTDADVASEPVGEATVAITRQAPGLQTQTSCFDVDGATELITGSSSRPRAARPDEDSIVRKCCDSPSD